MEVLHSRFGTNGEGIPLEMCPCGNRKATLRRFLVARKYVVDDAEKMLRDTIDWRTNVDRWREGSRVDIEIEATLGFDCRKQANHTSDAITLLYQARISRICTTPWEG